MVETLESQRKRDEALARLLQQVVLTLCEAELQSESQEIQKKLLQEKEDADLALKLLVEEKMHLEKEETMKKASEEVAKQLQLDLAMAERLAEEVCELRCF